MGYILIRTVHYYTTENVDKIVRIKDYVMKEVRRIIKQVFVYLVMVSKENLRMKTEEPS